MDIELNHLWVGDLTATLIAPGNVISHVLFGRTGTNFSTSCGDNSNLSGVYSFRDTAVGTGWWETAAAAVNADNILEGPYRTTEPGPQPTNATSPFTNMVAAFAGVTNPNGTWVLRLQDASNGDIGSCTAATLRIATGVLSTEETETKNSVVSFYPNPVDDVLHMVDSNV